MVWAGFGNRSKTYFAFPTGLMKANNYQDLLDTHLLVFGEVIGGPFWIFRHDNANIHVANSTWEWILRNWVHLIIGQQLRRTCTPRRTYGLYYGAQYMLMANSILISQN